MLLVSQKANVFGGSGKREQRDSACTPKWVAELVGPVMLDPATNSRSHISSTYRCMLENGGDGLAHENEGPGSFVDGDHSFVDIAESDWSVFINCGYNRGEVIRWVNHYGHTRFIFLLKWSPDTEWFAHLLPKCTHVWFPLTRVDFDPPPGVEFSSNPLPHALYLREPSAELQKRLRGAGWLLRVDAELLDWVSRNWHTWKHEHRQTRARVRKHEGKGSGVRGGKAGVSSGSVAEPPVKRATGKAKAGKAGETVCEHFVTPWACERCRE